MAVKNSVFGSEAEKLHFRKLQGRWNDGEFEFYHNLPFLQVFDIKGVDLEEIGIPLASVSAARSFFYKTSIDYVLCDKTGKPLLALDFDGLLQGHSRGKEYVCPNPDAGSLSEEEALSRAKKFGYKLKFAAYHRFPYIVVEDAFFAPVGGGDDLTLADGVIGTLLEKVFNADFYDREEQMLDELRENERWRYLNDRLDPEHSDYHDFLAADLEFHTAHQPNDEAELSHHVFEKLEALIATGQVQPPRSIDPIHERFWFLLENLGYPHYEFHPQDAGEFGVLVKVCVLDGSKEERCLVWRFPNYETEGIEFAWILGEAALCVLLEKLRRQSSG